jgi:hypothetical protein
MNRTITIHAGIYKTGSTAFQNAIFAQRDSLLGDGILYPLTGLLTTDLARGARHRPLFRSIRTEGEESLRLDMLDREVEQSGCTNILVSYEAVFSRDFVPSAIASALQKRRYDVRLVVVLRNPLDALESRYREWIGTGMFAGEIDEYFRDHEDYLAYAPRLDEWGAALGPSAVTAIPYEGLPRDRIVEGILTAAKLQSRHSAFIPTSGHANHSLSNLEVLALLIRNRLELAEMPVVADALGTTADISYKLPKGRLTSDDLAAVLTGPRQREYESLIRSLGHDVDLTPKWSKSAYDAEFYSEERRSRIRSAIVSPNPAPLTRQQLRIARLQSANADLRRRVRRLELLKVWEPRQWRRYVRGVLTKLKDGTRRRHGDR